VRQGAGWCPLLAAFCSHPGDKWTAATPFSVGQHVGWCSVSMLTSLWLCCAAAG
jgi:hypothetical protein